MKSFIKSGKLDRLGMTASLACAIHCAVLPLVVTSLPLIGLEFLANVWVEISMILLSVVIGTWSLATTYKKLGNLAPVLTLLTGFVLIAAGHFFWHDMEALLIPLGGLTVAGAHFMNWKLNRVCGHNHHETGI